MIFHTGPTKLALVLLCCIGTWLASYAFTIPIPDNMTQRILELLKLESKELYENYLKGDGAKLSIDKSIQLPCFTLERNASENISKIQAYLEKAKVLNENRINTANVAKRLNDISCEELQMPTVPGPTDSATILEIKTFILTVLKQFSDCMATLKPTNMTC